jgi:GntR family transcriptional regulator
VPDVTALEDDVARLLRPVPPEQVAEPKYWAAKQSLLAFCRANRPGTAVPPERRLAEEFGISRMTVRQAMQELVVEGHLTRGQGRGTSVAPPKLTHEITMGSTSQAMSDQGIVATSRVLSVQTMPAPGDVAERLGLAPETPVVALERLRYANSDVMALDYSYFEAARFPGLVDHLSTGRGLYETLETEYDALPVRAEETIEAAVASPRVAGLLDTETGAPLLLAQRFGRLADGTPVEWSSTWFRGDRYRFLLRLAQDANAG